MCRFKKINMLKNDEILSCFNTSYVSVQDTGVISNMPTPQSFNTSYVSVQEFIEKENDGNNEVSIHHMCRFKPLPCCTP